MIQSSVDENSPSLCHLWFSTTEIWVILLFVAAIIKKWGYSFTWGKNGAEHEEGIQRSCTDEVAEAITFALFKNRSEKNFLKLRGNMF